MITLKETQSICPECSRLLEAKYIEEKDNDAGENRVYLWKKCPEHGEYKVLVAGNPEDYKRWIMHPVVNIPPKRAITPARLEMATVEGSRCPLDCGTCEAHMQTACCVLIDVTTRCDQHCPYCFAVAGEENTPLDGNIEGKQAGEPSLAEMEKKYDLLLELGEERPFNIQLSGGEPAMREDLPEIVALGRRKGFEYIQINTNGRRLAAEPEYALRLKKAGASVIFLQFDGTREEIYEELRGEPLFELKKKAVESCRRAGLPVTLVPTVTAGVNSDNLGEIVGFMLENLDIVKGVHFQPVAFFGRYPKEQGQDRITMFDVMEQLEKQTGGVFRREDLCPITAGHPLCCFYGAYLREPDGKIVSTLTEKAKAGGMSCCDTELDMIKQDRDFVLNRWELAEEEGQDGDDKNCGCCCSGEADGGCDCHAKNKDGLDGEESVNLMDLDQFASYMKRNMFTISGMAFMDLSNLDSERLKRCRVQVLSPDERLIPFCAYNSVYR